MLLALAAAAAGPASADQTFYHASTGPNPGVATPGPNASGVNVEYIYPPYYGQPCLRNGHYVDCRCPRTQGWNRCRPWPRPGRFTPAPRRRRIPGPPIPRPVRPLANPVRPAVPPPAPPIRAWPGFGSPAPAP